MAKRNVKTETTEPTDKSPDDVEKTDDEIDDEDLKFATRSPSGMTKKQLSNKMQKQRNLSGLTDAAIVGGAGVLGEVIKMNVLADAMNDPSVKAAEREIARLEAITEEDAPEMSLDEQQAIRNTASNQIKRLNEENRRNAQSIAASMGQSNAATFLALSDAEIDRLTSDLFKAEAEIGKEKTRRTETHEAKVDAARKALQPLKRDMYALRNELERKPKIEVANAILGGGVDTLAAAPRPDFEDEIQRARENGATDEQIEKLIKMSRGLFAGPRIKAYMKKIGVYGDQKPEIPPDKQGRQLPKPPPEEEETGSDTPTTEAGSPEAPPPPPPPTTTEQVAGTEFPSQIYDYASVSSVSPGAQGKGRLYRMRSKASAYGKDDPTTKVNEGQFSQYVFEFSNYGPGGEPVWAVYNNNPMMTPVKRSGTDQPLFFTVSQAKDSTNPIIKDLYSVGLKEGLYG